MYSMVQTMGRGSRQAICPSSTTGAAGGGSLAQAAIEAIEAGDEALSVKLIGEHVASAGDLLAEYWPDDEDEGGNS